MIASSAIVEDGAKIGTNVSIGANVFIGKDVTIADNVVIHHGAYITGITSIDEGSQIYPYACVGTPPQDLRYAGEPTRLEIGKRVSIREFAQINTGTIHGGGATRIGDDSFIMGHTHIAHDVQIGKNVIISSGVMMAGHVEIDDHAILGGTASVHQFVRIGSYAMLGGASALTQDLPPFCLAQGNHARLRSLNIVGLRRNFANGTADALKPVFKMLFTNPASLNQTAKDILQNNDNEQIKELCEFVLNSQRGICSYKKSKACDED